MHPDTFDGPSTQEPLDRSFIEPVFQDISLLHGYSQYLARRDGQPAGAASMRLHEGIAQLCGAATLPAHRRLGIQTALLRERLICAARAGCDVAIVTTEPGSKSQENVQRQGFELLYVRAIMIKG
jgi:ribosomal protein S18 acetylase RimI-like enzyme